MSTGGQTPPVIRHLLVCQHITYDADNPAAPYSLHGLVSQVTPDDEFPVLLDELWVFFQAFGDPGDYQFWFDLVPVDDDGEAIGEETTYGPYILIVHEDTYLEHRGWKLLHLPFTAPGRYEIWLWYASDVLAREQFLVREV